jgi:hypothetical protein
LHVLPPDVSKVDRMLHLPPHFLLPRLVVSSSPPTPYGRLDILHPLPLL